MPREDGGASPKAAARQAQMIFPSLCCAAQPAALGQRTRGQIGRNTGQAEWGEISPQSGRSALT
jgi:hypothetical protein